MMIRPAALTLNAPVKSYTPVILEAFEYAHNFTGLITVLVSWSPLSSANTADE